ncbi:MAG: hypothetical protein ACPGU7_05315 [Gammaproteobacteria bacterium]
MKDIKPIFEWAEKNGDVKVIDRILIRLLPVFLEHGIQLTDNLIRESDAIEVPDALYDEVLKTASSLVGTHYPAESGDAHV